MTVTDARAHFDATGMAHPVEGDRSKALSTPADLWHAPRVFAEVAA